MARHLSSVALWEISPSCQLLSWYSALTRPDSGSAGGGGAASAGSSSASRHLRTVSTEGRLTETQGEKMLRVSREGRGGEKSKNAKDIKNINREVGESFSACICRKSCSLKVTTGRLDVRTRFHHRGLGEPLEFCFFPGMNFFYFCSSAATSRSGLITNIRRIFH